jgi:hypothetical protein
VSVGTQPVFGNKVTSFLRLLRTDKVLTSFGNIEFTLFLDRKLLQI